MVEACCPSRMAGFCCYGPYPLYNGSHIAKEIPTYL